MENSENTQLPELSEQEENDLVLQNMTQAVEYFKREIADQVQADLFEAYSTEVNASRGELER